MEIFPVFERLESAGARYVLVGATALLLHGVEIAFTNDLDFAITLIPEDRDAILSAFADLDPQPMRAKRQTLWDVLSIRAPWTKIMTTFGEIDLLVSLPGITDGFEGLYKRSVVFRIDDVPYRVACLEDLALMKAASSRPKDEIHLHAIRDLQRLLAEGSADETN